MCHGHHFPDHVGSWARFTLWPFWSTCVLGCLLCTVTELVLLLLVVLGCSLCPRPLLGLSALSTLGSCWVYTAVTS